MKINERERERDRQTDRQTDRQGKGVVQASDMVNILR